MPNDDQNTKTETEAQPPAGGGFAAPICSTSSWEEVAHGLAKALDGCRKRYVLTLGEITGDPDPAFDPPAPSALDNLHAVTLALANYDMLRAETEAKALPQP